MNKFIIVLVAMIITLLFTRILLHETPNINISGNDDIILNFNEEKIKCKCNLDDKSNDIKENFANIDKEFIVEKPEKSENLITSIVDIDEAKRVNINAEKYFIDRFSYPIEPLQIVNKDVFASNQYRYMNIGSDIDKVID